MDRYLDRLADTIACRLNYTEDQRAVVRYGLVALVQTVIIFSTLLLAGLIFGFLPEALAVFFTVVLLRKQEGGAHASSLTGCLILTGVVLTALAVLSRRVFSLMAFPARGILTAVLFLICGLISWKLAPVESPNKPLRDPKKRARLRRNTFVLLTAGFLASVLLGLPGEWFPLSFPGVGFAILSGTVWQTFTLTPAGRWFVEFLEAPLRKFKRS